MIEVGIPFSDPIADGPVIQAAGNRSLCAGVRTADCFELIAGFRARHPHVPVGILTYANLVMARGRRAFFKAAAEAGADSLLVADLPILEAEPWTQEMRIAGIEPVLIAAANTPTNTLREIARLSSGYTYCVTRPGITGTHQAGLFDAGFIERLNDHGAPPPVFGFGISKPEHVREVGRWADAAVVGSALVNVIAEAGASDDLDTRVEEYVRWLKA